MSISSTSSTANTSAPVADPTIVFITKQVTYTVSSLAMVGATVILALNHFIADGEIVTLLVTAVGAHVLASVNGTASNNTTDNSVNTPTVPAGTTVTTVPNVPVAQNPTVVNIAPNPNFTPPGTTAGG